MKIPLLICGKHQKWDMKKVKIVGVFVYEPV